MSHEPADVSSQLNVLTRRLAELEGRVESLERREPRQAMLVPGGTAVIRPADGGPLKEGPPLSAPAGALTLLGRTLVVFGGGFLLRALTDENVIPASSGIVAGLAYAGWWLGRADAQAERADRRASAVVHGLAATSLAYPLIIETTLRFHLIGASLAGSLVFACFVSGLFVAHRRELRLVGWSNVLFAVLAALILLVGTRDLLPLTLSLLAMGVALESQDRRYGGPRLVVALAADLAVALCAWLASRPEGLPPGYTEMSTAQVVTVALLLPTLYLGSATFRTLREQQLSSFEVFQTPLALALGFLGASRVLSVHEGLTWPLGAVALVLGAACYLAAFAVVDRRANQAGTFYAYTTLAVALTFSGLAALLPAGPLGLALGALGLGGLGLADRYGRKTLRFHGVAYLFAAAAVSGLTAAGFDGLLASPTAAWRVIGWPPLVIAGALVLGYGVMTRGRSETGRSLVPVLPRGLVAALICWCLAGLVAQTLARALGWAPGPAGDAAAVAAIRTLVLATLALVLAWVGPRCALPELVPLAYAALAAGGLKLLFEDFRLGRPVTLFVALAAYGGTLVATPRLLSRSVSPPSE